VALQKIIPEFSLFRHEFFSKLEYSSFKKKLEERMNIFVENTSNFSLKDGSDFLHALNTSHSTQMAELKKLRNDVHDIKEKLDTGIFL
jgi:hypothetical protein